jgi:hypothetical protein
MADAGFDPSLEMMPIACMGDAVTQRVRKARKPSAGMHLSLMQPRAISAFPPLLGVERTSVGQPLNEYTA